MYTEAKIVLWVLKRETMKRITSENMKILQITNEDYESYLNQANCHIWKKKKHLKMNTLFLKFIVNLGTTVIMQANT